MAMSDKFQNKYRIASARHQHWDYGWNAAYFVTICTKAREHFFGEIINEVMELSEIGKLAEKFWLEIPKHFSFVELDAFVVMPNHVHGIILINKPDNDSVNPVETRHCGRDKACLVSTNPEPHIPPSPDKTIGQERFQNQGKNTLSSIIGSYKSVLTKFARQIHADFAWQTRFHDHIIRNHESHEQIKHYIFNNPQNWKDDTFY